MKVWYKVRLDTAFTMWTYGREVRPDEKFFEAPDRPWEDASFCSIYWDRNTPSLVAAPDLATQKEVTARDRAFARKKDAIIERRQEKNAKDFKYNGVKFVSDELNILATHVMCMRKVGTEPIPTFPGTVLAGMWISADGTPVPFTCGQFLAFGDAYFQHRAINFGTYTLLTAGLIDLYASGATKEQLQDYDISQGWD
jgi:hypothetical protein